MDIKLTDIKQNQSAVIKEIVDNPLIAKMFEFGVLPGATFTVLNKAPFHGPISILVDDTRIALRQQEANCILIES